MNVFDLIKNNTTINNTIDELEEFDRDIFLYKVEQHYSKLMMR